MHLKIKRLDPAAKLPTYGTEGAACFDIAALHDASFGVSSRSMVIRTGLAVEVPPGHVMMIYSRSGHGFKNSVRLANCVGIIDSDYRGEIAVKLTRDDYTDFTVAAGDRIAQAMIVPYPRVAFEEVEDLSTTERGAGGFGSTGVK